MTQPRHRRGGRGAGKSYAPPAPREAGHGVRRWPNRDYSGVQPRALREAYQWWQQICRDVAPWRRSRGWEQKQLPGSLTAPASGGCAR